MRDKRTKRRKSTAFVCLPTVSCDIRVCFNIFCTKYGQNERDKTLYNLYTHIIYSYSWWVYNFLVYSHLIQCHCHYFKVLSFHRIRPCFCGLNCVFPFIHIQLLHICQEVFVVCGGVCHPRAGESQEMRHARNRAYFCHSLTVLCSLSLHCVRAVQSYC